jgi:hypothetical protein
MVSDCVYELLPAMDLLFIPQVKSKNHGGMTSTGKTTDSSTRALWQSYQNSHLVAKHKELAKKINFVL